MILCDYGCGKEATNQFKNGKWCCSNHINKCKEYRKKQSIRLKENDIWSKGKKIPFKKRNRKKYYNPINTTNLCNYGCGNIAKFKLKNEKICCSVSINSCQGIIKKKLGRVRSDENKVNIANGRRGKKCKKEFKLPESILVETNEICSYGCGQKAQFYFTKLNKYCCLENYKKCLLLNGQALKMIKCIKKISNEELKLREMVKQIYSNCEFQYPVFNYALDIAIPIYKIAIEYDGYYHFNNPESINYHKYRQGIIEKEGWKFIRYTIFDEFPILEQIEKRINNIIEEK